MTSAFGIVIAQASSFRAQYRPQELVCSAMMENSGSDFKFGVRVQVAGRGKGVAALDNEDGTWNIEFDDGTDGDIPACCITLIEGNASDLVLGNTKNPSALMIWLHGRTDAPDGWCGHFENYLAGLLPYTRIDFRSLAKNPDQTGWVLKFSF